MERKTIGGREVLLEFQQVGGFVRVAAIDPATNPEITIVGSPHASRALSAGLIVRESWVRP